MVDIALLRASKKSKTSSGVVVNFRCRENLSFQHIRFAIIRSSQHESLMFFGASGLGGDPDVFLLDLPLLVDLQLFF